MSGAGGSVALKCVKCGAEFQQPTVGLKTEDDFRCPSCGQLYKPKEGLDGALAKARDMAREAFRGFGSSRKNR